MERRLDAPHRRLHRAPPGRQVEAADAHLRQSQPAADRRLLRALHLRLRPSAIRQGKQGRTHRAPAQPDHRPAHGEDRMGPELGRNSWRRVFQAKCRRELRRCAKGHLRPVREHLHDVPAAPVRALPEPGVRGIVPVGLDLQARGRRHRADRPGQVPRLAHVRVGLPLQEDLLQLAKWQGREVHLLLSAHRGGPADRLLGNLCGPHPLSGRDAL
ncbi:hypothetical protein SDC9_158004 [bioreactor metagenome]|uniref:Uncharacterized protein n=1 Tax=bioreactor metagenome TaxID=1076179 RepID=A0A645F904_9ZZZZ